MEENNCLLRLNREEKKLKKEEIQQWVNKDLY